MLRRVIGLSVALGIVASSSLALADTAEQLKEKGNQAMLQLNYVDALVAYKAALEKNPNDVVLHYNIGRAQQARGDYPAALDALREFERRAPPETRAKVPALDQLLGDVRSRVGELEVRCTMDAPGTIVVDATRVERCTTSPKRVRLSLAQKNVKVEVRFESEEYQAPSVNVAVEGGGPPAAVTLSVGVKSTTGLLRVVAAPAAAQISVDGTPKGNSPVEVSLPSGSHVVDVSADGHESARIPLVLPAGGRKEVDVTLDKSKPITSRWWFWTGAGVVAAGLITTVTILIVEPERESTKRGTIDPGVIRAPLITF